jgi:hypothetical protein
MCARLVFRAEAVPLVIKDAVVDGFPVLNHQPVAAMNLNAAMGMTAGWRGSKDLRSFSGRRAAQQLVESPVF